MTDLPQRIKLERTKGWKLPANTIIVSRPMLQGNPFTSFPTADLAVETYERFVTTHGHFEVQCTTENGLNLAFIPDHDLPERIRRSLPGLAGHNLACWCPITYPDGTKFGLAGARCPCHADVLLRLANPDLEFPWATAA